MKEATLRVFRGETSAGKTVDFRVPLAPGMVAGPRFFVRVAGLEMHPMDSASRAGLLRKVGHRPMQHHEMLHRGLPGRDSHHGQCHYPLKERVVDEFYDPLLLLVRKIRGAR